METGSEEKEECPLQCCCNQQFLHRERQDRLSGLPPGWMKISRVVIRHSRSVLLMISRQIPPALVRLLLLIHYWTSAQYMNGSFLFQQLFFFACSSFDNSADRCCPRGFRFGLGVGNDIGRRMGPCAGARGGSAIGLRRFGPNWGSDAGGRSGGGLGARM